MERQGIKTLIVLIICSISLVYAPPTGWRSAVGLTGFQGTRDFDPCIAVGSTSIHVINRDEGEFIECWAPVYCRSTDTGVQWTDGIELEAKPHNGHDRSVDIVANGIVVHTLYELMDLSGIIKYKKSTDGGTNWNSSVLVVAGGIHPRIAVDGALLHSFYARDVGSNYEMFRKQSTDGGNNWSDEKQLTNAIRNSWHPAVSVNGSIIHLVWADNQNAVDNYEIYYNKSTNNGGSWVWGTSGWRFTDVTGESEYPDVVAYSDENYNAVHVVWQDATTEDPGPGIYYRRSTNSGDDWQDPVLLFANGCHPAIAADERGLYVVWDKDGYVYYKESTDWGTTWQTTLRITNTADADSFPDITADDLGRHIVFARDREQIYYIQRDIVKPNAPRNLHTNGAIPPPVVLLWDANTESDLDKYRVYRRQLPFGWFSQIGSTENPTYTDNTFPVLGCWYEYYVTAVDLANNESDPSEKIQVYVPDPGDRLDLGQIEPSPNTLERAGYHAWGKDADSTADFGGLLRYKFTDLNPEHDYTFGFALFEPAFDSGRVVSLCANNYNLVKDLAIPESAQWVCFRIPKSLYSQGSLAFILSGENEAVLSQIGIWEWGKGGPQSNGTMLIDPTGLEMFITPNPVKRMASIDYFVPFDTKVKLAIYDATGQMVKTVINTVQAAGSYKKSVNVSCLPNGIYFINLDMGDHSLVQKMVIIK